MNVCLNGIPLDSGAWTRRPGTIHAGTTRGGSAGREVGFSFRESVPYKMEFTDGYLRFRVGTEIVMTNDEQAVVSISTASPAKVTTGVHGWTSGFSLQFNTLGTPDALLENRTFIGTVTSTTEFTLTDAITGAAIDGSTLATFTTGNVTRIKEIVTPFTGAIWQDIRSVQTEERAVLLCGTVAPQLLSVTTEPENGVDGFAEFSLDTANFIDGPYLDPLANGVQVTPSAKTGVVQLTLAFAAYDSTKAYSVNDFVTSSSVNYKSLVDQNVGNTPASSPSQWLAVAASQAIGPNGFVATDIGRHVRLFSEPPEWVVGGSYTAVTSVVKYNNAYYTCLTNNTGTLANAPGISVTNWGVNPQGALWSWGKITGLLNQISQSLSGASNIGDLTLNGGLAAAFNGNINQTSASCALALNTLSGSATVNMVAYIGRSFASASDQKIASVTVFPPSNKQMCVLSSLGGGGIRFLTPRLDLYGSATLPAHRSDGTLLGSTPIPIDPSGLFAGISPVTIVSSDTTTAWKYVWVSYNGTYVTSAATTYLELYCGQLQMFNPSGTGSSGSAVNAEILGPALLYTTNVTTWRLGMFGGTVGWPRCGTYHEGRLWLSGSVRNRIDGSKPIDSTINVFNFAPTEKDGTVTDASAISYTFRAKGVNSILWMESDQQGILCGTQAGKWLVQASANNNVLTVTSIQAHPVPSDGCANVEPARTGLTLSVIHRYKHKIMEYFADVFSGKFASQNLSLMAKHLATRGIERIAFQEELTPTIWAQCADNTLIGASYKRESLVSSQGPTFIGWHRTTLGSGRDVEGVCVGPSSDGLLDSLSLVTNDPATGIRHVEVMSNLWEEESDISASWFVDDGVAPTITQNVVFGGVSTMRCSGLWHLNGKTVAVVAGGLDLGDYLVTDGACSVPYGVANGLFTTAFVASFTDGMPVAVGFTYNSDGQIVRPSSPQESGARNGPAMGKKRRTEQFSALLQDTQGISFGTTFAALKPALFKAPGGAAYAENALYSGTFWRELQDDYSFDSMICWRVSRPYPATVCAISGYLSTQDR